jgi:beta-fructofuranosidase
MSLPRRVSLAEDDSIVCSPAPEINILRNDLYHTENTHINPSEVIQLPLTGNCLEIMAVFDFTNAKYGVILCCSPDGQEKTQVGFDYYHQNVFIDRTRSGLSSEVNLKKILRHYQQKEGEPLRLHIYLDRSVLEIFVNDDFCLSCRIYPTRKDSVRVGVFSINGEAVLRSLDVWKMNSIWMSIANSEDNKSSKECKNE